MEILIGDRFHLGRKLGEGGFSEVFEAMDKKTKQKVALKLETRTNPTPMLFYESKIQEYLKGVPGIPSIKASGFEGDFNYMAMEALGDNLQSLFEKNNCRFSLKSVLLLADQFLTIIEAIHSKYMVHRDIKPENFLLGRGDKGQQIYAIDFGLSKRFIEKNGKHIPYVEGKEFRGTLRYCSKNMHAGIENSRRDDIESIGYLLVYFLKGKLPWQNMKIEKAQKASLIAKKKYNTLIQELTQGLPAEFTEFFNYVKDLQFAQTPDYEALRNLFRQCYQNNNCGTPNGLELLKNVKDTAPKAVVKEKNPSTAKLGTNSGFEGAPKNARDVDYEQFFKDIAGPKDQGDKPKKGTFKKKVKEPEMSELEQWELMAMNAKPKAGPTIARNR